jgi:hypothetical protein
MWGSTTMSEKEELTSERQKKLLLRLVEELSLENGDFYYQPTSEIASALKTRIDDKTNLTSEELKLLESLSRNDIQMLLSLH